MGRSILKGMKWGVLIFVILAAFSGWYWRARQTPSVGVLDGGSV